ncbi:MAG TPA: YbgC/FadM family acyl-CoA thioesterase [Polyangia bacterium]
MYFEDADVQGVVHHPNYLRFCERARSELIESHGLTTRGLEEHGCHLTVYEVTLKYRQPARIGDRLEVVSRPRLASEYRITFAQSVTRADAAKPLCDATIQIVCLDDAGKLVRIPPALAALCEPEE